MVSSVLPAYSAETAEPPHNERQAGHILFAEGGVTLQLHHWDIAQTATSVPANYEVVLKCLG